MRNEMLVGSCTVRKSTVYEDLVTLPIHKATAQDHDPLIESHASDHGYGYCNIDQNVQWYRFRRLIIRGKRLYRTHNKHTLRFNR